MSACYGTATSERQVHFSNMNVCLYVLVFRYNMHVCMHACMSACHGTATSARQVQSYYMRVCQYVCMSTCVMTLPHGRGTLRVCEHIYTHIPYMRTHVHCRSCVLHEEQLLPSALFVWKSAYSHACTHVRAFKGRALSEQKYFDEHLFVVVHACTQFMQHHTRSARCSV